MGFCCKKEDKVDNFRRAFNYMLESAETHGILIHGLCVDGESFEMIRATISEPCDVIDEFSVWRHYGRITIQKHPPEDCS